MDKEKEIEEMEDIISCCWNTISAAKKLYNAGYRKVPDGAVVLTKEEYEKLKSLYDCQHGSIMTSSIGDLPLTIGGLRKAVDEISRLINVQTELQVLNAKYYNEAKHLRRELKQARNETAKEFAEKLKESLLDYIMLRGITDKRRIFECIDELLKEYEK